MTSTGRPVGDAVLPAEGQGTQARRLLSLPYPGDATSHALRIAEAQTCAILAAADAIEELTRQIAGARSS